ncbi:glycosyltransferase [Actinoallomurus sp. CA-150999]|uniref:glycosyltransferase family 4 protein n=1 Tax=Actinoallomurus sp. CA-150999 TaxID=3239887 RepID=UPI003D8FDD50
MSAERELRTLAIVNWRDPWHPEAGGAERYAWEMARWFAARGTRVRFVTGRAPGQAARERIEDVEIVRRGGRFTVYPLVLAWMLARRRAFDAVLDCQNGIPFFTPWVLPRRVPILCVVHHVHDGQFHLYFPAWLARLGRFLEGPVARRAYRRHACVAVSPSTVTAMRERLAWTGPVYLVPNGVIPPDTAPGPDGVTLSDAAPDAVTLSGAVSGPSSVTPPGAAPVLNGVTLPGTVPGPSGVTLSDTATGPGAVMSPDAASGLGAVAPPDAAPGPSGVTLSDAGPGPEGVSRPDAAPDPNGVTLSGAGLGPAGTDDEPELACVSRLVPHKRVGRLLDVAERLRVRVHVIGRGPEEAALRAQVAARGLEELVVLHGYLPEEEKDALVARARIHLSASRGEGWGLSVAEAAAFGVPTVAYDVDGLRDAVVDGVTGWLVPEGEELADVIERALKELSVPERRRETAAACRAWAAEFTWARSAERMAALLDAAVRRGTAQGLEDRSFPWPR